jgi:hypothetical protein
MSKLVVDTIQRPGGAAMSFPVADGTAGQFLKTDAAGNLTFSNSYTFPSVALPIIAQEGKGIVGSVSSFTDRYNSYSGGPQWSSSGPWTTYVNYNAYDDNNLIQFINMALGDGLPQGTSEWFIGDDDRGSGSRTLQFANGDRLGYKRDRFQYSNQSSYGGHTFRIMPIRNNSNAAISVSFYARMSDYYNAGYEGCCMFVLAPNTSTYSTVTTVSTTRLSYSTSSGDTNGPQAFSGSYSIPANTTVLVCLASTNSYQTTYRFKDTNYFYYLNTSYTFANANIVCDMRMLSSLYASNFNLPNSGTCNGTGILAPLWTKTATNFGDR